MPIKPTDAVYQSLVRFADDVKRTSELAKSSNAQPEDQLKPLVKQLVEEIGQAVRMNIEAVSETRLDDFGRPDFGVLDRQLLLGFIELKAPEVDIFRLRGRDALQLKRFRAIPNLIYTNGSDWVFYRRAANDTESQLLSEFTVRIDSLLEVGGKAVSLEHARDLLGMFREFLYWTPIVPSTAKGLAEQLAPLTRLLRDEVVTAVNNPEGEALSAVYGDWQRNLFPAASVEEFADSYAQTVTYGLLLAHIAGSNVLEIHNAVQTLESRSALLARTLTILTQPGTRHELGIAIELLERSISAVDQDALDTQAASDPWLYFYEDFLAVYDPRLRNARGVYYTPAQIVQAQVRLVDDVLRRYLGRENGIASDDVTILDPALGTGTYLLTALQHGAERYAQRFGQGHKGATATRMARNLYGFELLVGPYAVAHVRLTQLLHDLGGQDPEDGLQVYLTDTLESPNTAATLPMDYFYRPLTEERRRAREVKAKQPILVCIGNPPYERENTGESGSDGPSKGGWITEGDSDSDLGLFDSFLASAREAGHGDALQPLRNSYVYFWRWALWKTVEQTNTPGVVAFITASSFLTGRAFSGMRRHMRKVFDRIFVLDLGGDAFGTRVSENVFQIRSPVAITICVANQGVVSATPAQVSYSQIDGTRAEKLEKLSQIVDLDSISWEEVDSEWMSNFVPTKRGNFSTWPQLTDMFPLSFLGTNIHRRWPVGESADLLEERWRQFLRHSDRAEALYETRDRKIARSYGDNMGVRGDLPPLATLKPDTKPALIHPYAFRTFDLQYLISDTRLVDRSRPALWRSLTVTQLYLTTLVREPLGQGSGAYVSAYVPDLNSFNNRSGRVTPLYRDSEGAVPNITAGLLNQLQDETEIDLTSEDLIAYVAGIMGSPAYTAKFEEELATPGPRIPITKDGELFQSVAEVGKQVIAWQTYARRFPDAIDTAHAHVPQGSARLEKEVPPTAEAYPETLQDIEYNDQTRELKVGEGLISNVAPEVFHYEVSGFKVVRSWLGYRVKNRSGRKSSPLDDIRPEYWSGEMTEGLMYLLWAVEGVVNLEPLQAALLEEVLAGEVFLAEELPTPTDAERKPPSDKDTAIQPRLL